MDTFLELLKKRILPATFNEKLFLVDSRINGISLICDISPSSPLKNCFAHVINLVIKYSQLNGWKPFSLEDIIPDNVGFSEEMVDSVLDLLGSPIYGYGILSKSDAGDYSITLKFFEEFAEYFTYPLPSDLDLMGFTKLKNHLDKSTPDSTPDEMEELGGDAGLKANTIKKILLYSLFNGNKWQAISPSEVVNFGKSEDMFHDDAKSVERMFRRLAKDGFLEQQVTNDLTSYLPTEKMFEMLNTVLRR